MIAEIIRLGPWSFLALLGIIFVGATIQGTTGFGLGLFAAPVMALIDARLLPAALILVSVPLPLLTALREPGQARWQGLGWAFAGRLVGTAAGLVGVAAISPRALSVVVAGTVLAAVVLSVATWHPVVTGRSLLIAGFLSGAAGTATSVGSPPMALLLQRSTGPELRTTLGWFFFAGTTVSTAGLALTGQITSTQVVVAAWLTVPLATGFALSGWLKQYVDSDRTRVAVLTLTAISALALLARAFGT